MSWCYRQLYFDLCFADDVLGDEEDEEESDAVVTQVLDELGLQLTDNLAGVDVPTGSISVGTKDGKKAVAAGAAAGAAGGASVGGATDADADLQARLDDLRRE